MGGIGGPAMFDYPRAMKMEYRSTLSTKTAVWRFSFLGLLLIFGWPITQALGAYQQGDSGPTPIEVEAPQNSIEKVSLGFGGKIVLGRWNALRIYLQNPESDLVLRVQTQDGDAVPVRTIQTPRTTDAHLLHGLVRIGRVGSIQIELAHPDGTVIASKTVSVAELAEKHVFERATDPLLLCLGVDPQNQNITSLLPANRSVIGIDAAELPPHWLGYDSVQQIFLTTEFLPFFSALQPSQIQAIADWVHMGGQLLVASGKNANLFAVGNQLEKFAPGLFVETKQTTETGPLELAIRSSERLVKKDAAPLTYSVFEVPQSDVLFTIDDQPAVMRQALGFGTLVFMAFDLNSEPFVSWTSTPKLLQASLPGNAASGTKPNEIHKGKISHIGYDDFTGQLRAAMDHYDGVKIVTFTTVALLVGLFILLVAPGDYFFVKKLLKRPELTWITFPAIVLLFCGLAFGAATLLKSKGTEVNQLEIIDIDTRSLLARGTWWTSLYSPTMAEYDIRGTGETPFFGTVDEQWFFWQGLPGNGLGGMQSKNDLGTYRVIYDCNLHTNEQANHPWNGSDLKRVPVQAGATKSLTGRWVRKLDRTFQSDLTKSKTTDALQGTFTNPLDTQLTDCVILFGSWAYLLERPLQPGEEIDIESEMDMKEKTIKSFFTRQRDNDSDVNVAWNTLDLRWNKIVRLMMFYDAIGGQAYTQLTHRYQGHLDLSAHLELNQAILIGRTQQGATPIEINGKPISKSNSRQETYVRVLFPVASREQSWENR